MTALHERRRDEPDGPTLLRRVASPLVALLLALGALYVIISPRVAEHLLFFPTSVDPGDAPTLAGVEGEDLTLETSDGVRVHGWWHEVAPDAPAVLFLHGNAGTIAGRIPLAEAYLTRGVSILMLDYRGYGRSEGSPREEGVYRDAEAGLEWLRGRVGEEGRIVIHGRSLGGVVAAHAARDREELGGVVLEATFTSLDQIARAVYPFLPPFLLRRLRGHFDAATAVDRIRAPVLVVHGSRDEIVPNRMGRELYELAPGPKEWFEVPGAGHNDVFFVGGERYFDRLAAFVGDVTGAR